MAREFAKEEQEHIAFMRAFLGAGAPAMPPVRPRGTGNPCRAVTHCLSALGATLTVSGLEELGPNERLLGT